MTTIIWFKCEKFHSVKIDQKGIFQILALWKNGENKIRNSILFYFYALYRFPAIRVAFSSLVFVHFLHRKKDLKPISILKTK